MAKVQFPIDSVMKTPTKAQANISNTIVSAKKLQTKIDGFIQDIYSSGLILYDKTINNSQFAPLTPLQNINVSIDATNGLRFGFYSDGETEENATLSYTNIDVTGYTKFTIFYTGAWRTFAKISINNTANTATLKYITGAITSSGTVTYDISGLNGLTRINIVMEASAIGSGEIYTSKIFLE